MPKKKSTTQTDMIEMLFNSLPFSYVFWKDTKGIYKGASTNQLEAFDSGKGFIGKDIYQILDDYDSAKAIDDVDNEIMRTGLPQTIEESVTTMSGEKKIFISQKQPIKDSSGTVIGLIGFSIDITERKILEDELKKAKIKAEAASRAKDDLFAI